MDSLKSDINLLLDQKVKYSRTGGGASSILLIIFEDESAVWAWRYWEISKGDQLIACSEDDDTPITGVMAVAARQLEGTVLEYLYMDDTTYQLGSSLIQMCVVQRGFQKKCVIFAGLGQINRDRSNTYISESILQTDYTKL